MPTGSRSCATVKWSANAIRKTTSHDELIRLMVGRSLQSLSEKLERATFGPVRLEVKQLTSGRRFQDISFAVRAGEIVGMAGLVGAGRSFVAQALFGIVPIDGGEILIDGEPVQLRNPRGGDGARPRLCARRSPAPRACSRR